MQPEISIIIPEFKNTLYFTRCLNSVKRQTFGNYEIIISAEDTSRDIKKDRPELSFVCGSVYDALKSAAGDYILFLSETSLLTENVLEDLLAKTKENPESCFNACILGKGSNIFTFAKGATFCIYGTLFKKEALLCADFSCEEYLLVSKYYGSFENVVLDDDALIYETDPACLFSGTSINKDLFEAWIDSLGGTEVPAIEIYAFFEKCFAESLNAKETLSIAYVFAQRFKEALESNYLFAKECLKKVYLDSHETGNEEDYEAVRSYASLWRDNPVMLNMILELIGITRKKQEAYFTSSPEDFEFYDEYITEDEEKEALQFEELEMRIEKLEQNLKALPAEGAKGTDVPAGNYRQAPDMSQYLIGTDLADLVVRKYAEGSLGLGTLIKAFKAWLGFKRKKGKA